MASSDSRVETNNQARWLVVIGAALLLVLVSALFVALPKAQADGHGVAAFVEADNLNVRVGPNQLYDSVAVVPQNTLLILTARTVDGRWALTSVNGVEGWVAVVELNLPNSIAALPVIDEFPPVAVVRTGNLNVRLGPGLIYQPIAVVPEGSQIFLIGRTRDNAWALALIDMNTVGWVATGPIEASVNINALPLREVPPAPVVPAQPNGGGGFVEPPVEPVSPVVPDNTPADDPAIDTTPFGVIVGAERLNVRSLPNTNSAVVQTISGGDTVILLARTQGTTHVLVEVFDGQVGWVSSNFIAPSEPLINLPIEP